jgi:hypothetical protein
MHAGNAIIIKPVINLFASTSPYTNFAIPPPFNKITLFASHSLYYTPPTARSSGLLSDRRTGTTCPVTPVFSFIY